MRVIRVYATLATAKKFIELGAPVAIGAECWLTLFQMQVVIAISLYIGYLLRHLL
ncbi:hypothetical protein SAMN05216308_106179 [Nitrosospira sp. Nsp13]|jgi:hypothetical protein|nr:hypothetical protein SAMN05216308_106179 [Nitrosospira sp. Nsp13]